MRTAAVIPAFNEQGAIDAVVRSARQHLDMVFVVDDGSIDDTGVIAEAAGATVIRHDVNRGVGAAIATGLAAAREAGATITVQFDGDGQHDGTFVQALIEQVTNGADLAIGTRFELGFPMGIVRRSVIRLIAAMVSRKVGVRISDPTSGFRAFGTMAMDELIPVFPGPYLSDTVEVLLIASEAQLEIRTVPVRMTNRDSGQASSGAVESARHAIRIVVILLRHLGRRGGRSQ